MPRYSAQFRNTVLKKLLPPEGRSALSLAREYNLSVGTIYGSLVSRDATRACIHGKARMRDGTLHIEDGVQANRSRQLAEKLSSCWSPGPLPMRRWASGSVKTGYILSTSQYGSRK